MKISVVGAGAALAGPIIHRFLLGGHNVSAVYRDTAPVLDAYDKNSMNYCSYPKVDLTRKDPIPVIATGTNVLITLPGEVRNNLIGEMDLDEWRSVLENNLTSVFNVFRYWLPRMENNGNVVVVGSIVGSTGGYGCANYAAAKAGLLGLVRAAANEVAARGICVNLLELGYVNAGMGARLDAKVRDKVVQGIPLKRFAEVEEVVDAVTYLSKVRYMTGNTVTLAGGLR